MVQGKEDEEWGKEVVVEKEESEEWERKMQASRGRRQINHFTTIWECKLKCI